MPNKTDFNQFAGNYDEVLNKSITISGENSIYFSELKIKVLFEYLKGKKQPVKIMDYGCGVGNALTFVAKYFPQSSYTGLDPSDESIKIAKLKYPNYRFIVSDQPLKNSEDKYDLIFSSCVFHHIAPEERLSILKKISELLNPNGYFVLFEHNPYNPVTVNIVKNCPFDKDAVLLKPKYSKNIFLQAGFKTEKIKYYFFFPKLLSFMRPLEAFMSSIPFGGQYMLVGRKV